MKIIILIALIILALFLSIECAEVKDPREVITWTN